MRNGKAGKEICASRKLGSTTSSRDSGLPEMRGADNGLEDVHRVGSRLRGVGTARSRQQQLTRGARRAMQSHESRRPNGPLLLFSVSGGFLFCKNPQAVCLPCRTGWVEQASTQKLESQMVRARPEALETKRVQAVQKKAVKFTAYLLDLAAV